MNNRTQFVPILPRPVNGKEVVADTYCTTMISSTDDDNWRNVRVRPLAIRKPTEYSAHRPPLPTMREVSFKLMGQNIKVTYQDYEHGNTRSYVGSNQFPPQHSVGGSSSALQACPKETKDEANSATNSNKRKRSSSSSSPDQTPNKSKFPVSVRQLLCTGIFDGVPVVYSCWRREKTLRGTIQGWGYKCLCDACVRTNAEPLSAHAFEKHAGNQSLHPNRNIYFSNGKSVLAVVQELKETPPHELFEKMQTIIASPINQTKFNSWKATFIAQNPEYAESAERMSPPQPCDDLEV